MAQPSSTLIVVTIPLTANEALSGILGSVSIACWIFLLVPQLLENYRNGSATAISLPFLLIWTLGDVCSLLGAAWAGLVPTVVAIAVYFCIADGVLTGQCIYYNLANGREDAKRKITGEAALVGGGGDGDEGSGGRTGEGEQEGEQEPLLARQRSGSVTIPGSGSRSRSEMGRRRSSATITAAARRRSSQAGVLGQILEQEEGDETGGRRVWIKNTFAIAAIVVLGTVGWAIAWGSGAWSPTPVGNGSGEEGGTGPLGAQILGYASAVAYLGARIPQIVKNARDRSCEGLSLLFFILSLMGNLTYGAGIIFHSLDRNYIITNVPWLIGSLGTIVEDMVVFIQFHVYRRQDGNEEAIV